MALGISRVRNAAAALYGLGWEARRRAYAYGLLAPKEVSARVVSIGNMTTGGSGKTTLTLHLAKRALERGLDTAVICRRYRPGGEGRGDEERLYEAAIGEERVFAGTNKRRLAVRAAAQGHALLFVDDGFSHWGLERRLDIVLLDARDPWGGGRLLPAGRLREPRRALQRADVIVISRLDRGQGPSALLAEALRYAPAAHGAAGRHRIQGLRRLDGSPCVASGGALVVTATGNPSAVERTAQEAGFRPTELVAYRDHHWFSPEQARRELERARRQDQVLLLTAKDAVRWPRQLIDSRIVVIEVGWEWVCGGEGVEQMVMEGVPCR